MTAIDRALICGVLAVSVAAWPLYAQKASSASGAEKTRQLLAGNAHALESRGRPDMAIQIWQQILLSEPNNAEALAGLARDSKLTGAFKQAQEALDRLRAAHPNDPNIAKIESLTSSTEQSDQLRRAGDLARQGRNDEAMRIYRQLFGDHPPDDLALAYYQTLYGTADGKQQAITGLRALAARNPKDSHIAVQLGTLLTYDARTRAEGIRILQAHVQDANAREPLRQALLWDAANPESAAELRAYLKAHPQDQEIATQLKQNEAKLAQMNAGIARTPAERAAFAALNAHRLSDAQQRFMELLRKDPANSRAAAGMGFLRMQQSNFPEAIRYFTQAEVRGYRSATVESALATSRFWATMNEAARALDQNQFDVANAKYREALTLRPRSPQALSGMAGLLLKEQQYEQAANAYEELVKTQPRSADAWRGLFIAHARAGKTDAAQADANQMPATVRQALAHDPQYLRTLAHVYEAQGRPDEARRVLSEALALPFPNRGAGLSVDTRLEYAGILMDAGRYSQAATMYTQIATDDPSNVSAWMGLVSAHHQLGQDEAALAEVEQMSPATYEAALADPGFLSMLGGIYQQANKLDVAQNLLERAAKEQAEQGGQPSTQVQLQLAGIYLRRNNTAEAYALYRRVLTAHPDLVDGWKGLIASLQATQHSQEALQQIALIPTLVRKQLENDTEFLQTEAGVYAAVGDNARATDYLRRVQLRYAQMRVPEPPNVAIQNAWLLYNTRNDRALYAALMRLGGRQDLTAAQRETVQTIWANWSVQRATAAMENNNSERAVEILEAASQAFPDNLQVRKVLAGGYLKTGRAKDALAIYKDVPMEDATADDYQGAIGAALAANDKVQAETWLRQGLGKYPNSYQILSMAARFEQARGDTQRAAAYWRAAIAATPKVSATDRLAHDLAYPDTSSRPHRAHTAAELQQLLNPENEPFQRTTKLPPLPAYGPDPYDGPAPVAVSNSPSMAPQTQTITAPATTQMAVPEAPKVSPPADSTMPKPRKNSRKSSHGESTSGPSSYTGTMHLSPEEENITNTDDSSPRNGTPVWVPGSRATPSNQPAAPQQAPIFVPVPQLSSVPTQDNRTQGLRLSSAPMGNRAAQAQVRFSQQTDGQLTQGSAGQIRSLDNVAVLPPASTAGGAGSFNATQYTPSAQDAATGAYSAPNQQGAGNAAQGASAGRAKAAQMPTRKKSAPKTETVPTLVTAPGAETQGAPAVPATDAVQQTQQPDGSSGVSDQDLEQRNLPPLRGPWIRVQRERRQPSPREQAERELESLESSYSGWLGGAGVVNFRSGDPGYDRLSILEAPFEFSAALGYHGRFTLVAKPVFLDAGQADGNSVIQVQESSPGGRSLLIIPQPLGTDTNTGISATTSPNSTPPPQQNASGVGGEIQLAFPTFAIAGGYTPYGFLVSNWTGRLQWKPGNGPITINLVRDAVKDSQLSYGGLRDPGTASLAYPGTIWGGVISNQGTVQYAHGDAESGFYVGGGAQYLTGYQVQTNRRIEGNGGAYWKVWTVPESGTLTIGANFFGMHYAHNENAYTFGMGGYFSPQAYFLANIPFTWDGHSETKWHYQVVGGLGVQGFQQDTTPLFPLAGQKPSEIALNNAALPALTSVGANYNLRGTASYQISSHWFAGGFVTANNTRNYAAASAGFSIHYMFREQPSTVTAPTGLFPSDGLRPFTVP